MKRPLKVLLVEDVESDAEIALYELKRAGLECAHRIVSTKADLLDALEKFNPDIILSDFALPGFDGISALRACQAARPDIPFIFVSGTIDEDLAIEMLEKGAADYILKSNMRRLGAAVRRALRESKELGVRQRLESRVRFLAMHDPVTELPNRTLFRELLDSALARASRNNHRVALMILDLDRFQSLNRKIGHGAGDTALKQVAERIRKAARKGDTVARIGGDEFAVVLEGNLQTDQVLALAHRQLQAISQPIRPGDTEVTLTASIGVSFFPHDAEDIDALLRNADVAMYHAKESGRNTHQFYSAELDARTRRDELRRTEVSARLKRLTPREREVLDLLIAGKASKVIAYLLGTSTRTIDVHRARVMEKMEAESVADLVRIVVEQGQ